MLEDWWRLGFIFASCGGGESGLRRGLGRMFRVEVAEVEEAAFWSVVRVVWGKSERTRGLRGHFSGRPLYQHLDEQRA